jgi:hypothetical protein
MKMQQMWKIGCASVALLMSTHMTLARDYYMATNGSMNNPGTIEQPFAQIKQFSDIANPGDTLYIRGGTYTNSWGTTMTRSGSASGGYITYRNYPGEVPILDGLNETTRQSVCFWHNGSNTDGSYISHIRIQGLVLRNWARSAIQFGGGTEGNPNTRAEHIDIRYNLVDHCGQNGITLFSANNTKIQYNVVGRTGYDPNMGSWSSNINLYNMTGTSNLVDSNVAYQAVDVSSYRTDGNGLILDRSALFGLQGGMTATNNIFFWNGGAGIAVTTSGSARMFNNTLWENGKEPTYVNGGTGYVSWDTTDNLVFRNNLISQSFGQAIRLDKSYPNSDFSNNDTSGISFVDANNANFQLNSGSAGLNTGNSSGAPSNSIGFDPRVIKSQTTGQDISWFRYAPDFAYVQSKGGLEKCFSPVSRPQGGAYDKGAYENGSSSTGNPTFSLSTSVTPGTTVTPGGSFTASVTFNCTGGSLSNGMLGLRLNNSSGSTVDVGTTVYNQNLSSGGSKNVSHTFTAPTTAGTYKLIAAAWNNNDWGQNKLWQEVATVTVSSSGTATPGGRYAQAATDGRYYAGNLCQYVSVATNTQYRASVYVKGSGAVMLRTLPTSWATNLGSVRCNANGSWTKYEFTFNSGSNSQVVFSLDDAYGTSGTVQIDNCVLQRTSGDTSNRLTNPNFESGTANWNIRAPFSVP